MAFDSLTEKLAGVFKKLRGKGKLSETDVKEAMREIKLALLSADVSFKVTKEIVANITEKAIGDTVLESLTPAQQIVKIVNNELCEIMGGVNFKLNLAPKPPSVIMIVGLQGSGKTTNVAKIAGYFKNKLSKRPLLVACDVYRPAAITQLLVVGEQVDVSVFKIDNEMDVVKIAKEAVRHAQDHGNDLVFIDTAGRLSIDNTLMDELLRLKTALNPSEILLTVDAMTGQDAVNVAETFNNLLDITGVVLTKTDGDTRGGAALSVKYITQKPIKFVGTGEKLTELEPFYPERMASRILGMGDILSLIEKAEETFDEEQAHKLEKKFKTNKFDLNDFLEQLAQVKKMGPIENLLGLVPGVNANALKDAKVDPRAMDRTEAIIRSMTNKEREKPEILNGSRRKRIAMGSGTKVEEVNKLIKSFDQMKTMMKRFGKGKKGGKMGNMPF
ncbi:MAG: signal recognition particle protein [Clostridia bacterium]